MKTTNPFKRLASHVFPCLGLGLFLCLLPLQGCIEEVIKPTGEDSPAKLDLVFPGIAPSQAPETGSAEDYKITDFTVLVFNGQSSGAPGGQIVKRIDIADLSSQGLTGSSIKLRIQFYDFVFIGNAASDPALVTSLAAFTPGSNKTISDLEGLYVASTAFDSQKDIPTLGVYRGVQILGDNKLKVTQAGQILTGSWEVVLKRLGIRLDLAIETQVANQKNSYKQVEIRNIPKRVPLLPVNAAGSPIDNYPSNGWQVETPVRIYNVGNSDNNGAGWVAKNPGPGDCITYTRIILPSAVFSPVTDDSKKITLRAVYNDDSYVQTEIVPLAAPVETTNYTSAGNTWYKVRATLVNTGVEIISQPQAWEYLGHNASIDGSSLLHVEKLKASCSSSTSARIYFWTGITPPPGPVYVHPNGYTGGPGSGSSGYVVNDVFENLSGTGASNLHYNAGTGAGYIDIKARSGASSGTRRIFLISGSLRREITISN